MHSRAQLPDALERHAAQSRAKHRQDATGVSFLLSRPGHGLDPKTFAQFCDFHLPAALMPTPSASVLQRLRANTQDRVRHPAVLVCFKGMPLTVSAKHEQPCHTMIHADSAARTSLITLVMWLVCLQEWVQYSFQVREPTGRHDALALREWLHKQLAGIYAQGCDDTTPEVLAGRADAALGIYTDAFQELTRQVCSMLLCRSTVPMLWLP